MSYKELYINSATCHPTNDNNRAIIYPDVPLKAVTQVTCIEANIPFTYYTITAANNTFFLTEYASSTPGGGGTVRTVTVPPGNYTPSDIINTLPGYITAAGATGSAYSVTFSRVVNKLTLLSGTKYFDLAFNTTAPIAVVLGFTTTSTYANVQSVQAPNAVALGGSDTLVLRSNIAPTSSSMMIGNPASSANVGGNILAFIPILTTPGNYTHWVNFAADSGFIDIGEADMGTAEFWFTTTSSTAPIDFNGSFFSLKVGIRCRSTSRTSFDIMGGRSMKRSYPN